MFTSSEMAALLWQTQDNPDDIGEYAANQQQRALSGIVTDVLAVLAGLQHIRMDARADGYGSHLACGKRLLVSTFHLSVSSNSEHLFWYRMQSLAALLV